MIQNIKRYFAIGKYMRRLSQELSRRFGPRPFYTVEHVTQAVKRGGFSTVFIAYAHAIFCSQEDFDACYQAQGEPSNYHGLRLTVARRFFSGRRDFDAAAVIRKFRHANEDGFHESGIGMSGGGEH